MRKFKPPTEQELRRYEIHSAAFHGDVKAIRKHLREHGNQYVNGLSGELGWNYGSMGGHEPEDFEETPLHAAVRYGRIKAANLLLQNGANANARDTQGHTPLLRMFREGRYWPDMIMLLLKHGTDLKVQDSKYGMGFLHHVASDLHTRELSTPRDDKLAPEGKEERQAFSSWQKQFFILAQKAGANINARDKYGGTPLSNSLRYGTLDTLSFLVERGADVRIRVPVVFRYGSRLVGKFMKEREYWAVPLVSGSLLHAAAVNGDSKAAKFLIEKGLSLRAVDDAGLTPLERLGRTITATRRRIRRIGRETVVDSDLKKLLETRQVLQEIMKTSKK
ncbi:MAG TPA: ankyrin repeat domain-containing protein [Candidatus Norongarragalinales archaeon]|nr:ankyrin repeat domain-containing protein [Candidatus Norongarragalinales archaeon]